MARNNLTLLILGGCGFIGREISKRLSSSGHEVIVVCRSNPALREANIKYVVADLTNIADLKEKISNIGFVDILINCSGNINHSKDNSAIIDIVNNHFMIIPIILSVLDTNKLKKIIQIGTSDEYIDSEDTVSELTPLEPKSLYSISKYISGEYLRLFSKISNISCILIRPFIVFGPGQKSDRLIPSIINSFLYSTRLHIRNPNDIRDFLYISDFADAIEKIIYADASSFSVNIGSGEGVRLLELVDTIKRIVDPYGSKELITFSGNTKSKISRKVANINKAKKLLNWEPKTKLDKGIKSTFLDMRKEIC